LNASELPIMDGSSKYFVEALEKAEKSKMPKEIFMW
jgi:UDP-3-O-acyl-N-acetylglucosamine deacetylase